MKTLLSLSIFALILFACSGEETKSEGGKPVDKDTSTVDTVVVDTLSDDTLKAQGYDIDEEQNIEENIEKKYGEQWGFCECVVRNDSVNKAFANEMTEAETDKLMKRWDEIEKHCKKMLTAPNTTPEERSAYERKVRKCLRNAK